MSSFSALLNQCHVTERTLSSRLDQLELDIENGREVAQLEYQVRELLSEYTRHVDALGLWVEKEQSRRVHTAQLERQKTALQTYQRRFVVVQNRRRHRQRHTLLGQDTPFQSRQFASETDVWLDERNKLDHSNQMTSILIQQATEIQSNLSHQRASIIRSTGMIKRLTEMIPGLEHVMHRIRQRRRRDVYILAGVISMCTVLLLLYMMH